MAFHDVYLVVLEHEDTGEEYREEVLAVEPAAAYATARRNARERVRDGKWSVKKHRDYDEEAELPAYLVEKLWELETQTVERMTREGFGDDWADSEGAYQEYLERQRAVREGGAGQRPTSVGWRETVCEPRKMV